MVIAKGIIPEFIADLQHKAAIYDRLSELQGIHVPVCLGGIDLHRPYYYDFRVRITHILLLSWAGESGRVGDGQTVGGTGQQRRVEELVESLSCIHRAGVLHGDIRADNIRWNAEAGRIMLIDFERSTFLRPARDPLSLNANVASANNEIQLVETIFYSLSLLLPY